MQFNRTSIPDVILITPKIFQDERGYFAETFRKGLLSEFVGRDLDFVQDNESLSHFGVLRGLHFQIPPFAQAKLVRVIQGEVLDIAVDIRKNSQTFGKYISAVLSEDNKHQLFIPEGFAHGFVSLSKKCVLSYKVTNYYNTASERGIHYKDPSIAIDWPIEESQLTISPKDLLLPLFENATVFE